MSVFHFKCLLIDQYYQGLVIKFQNLFFNKDGELTISFCINENIVTKKITNTQTFYQQFHKFHSAMPKATVNSQLNLSTKPEVEFSLIECSELKSLCICIYLYLSGRLVLYIHNTKIPIILKYDIYSRFGLNITKSRKRWWPK